MLFYDKGVSIIPFEKEKLQGLESLLLPLQCYL
nr:MAG TPA: hypothetical protein [Caudoviricetes sp.]